MKNIEIKAHARDLSAVRERLAQRGLRPAARLHQVDYRAIGLESFGRPGNYLQRQIERWTKQYRLSETERIEAMDNLIAWLPQNMH